MSTPVSRPMMNESHSLKNSEKGKNFGLDAMRAMAIILVLVCHSGLQSPLMYYLGFYGVELFFVLSGFLIGQIIIRDVLQKPSTKSLITFYQRRWLRTLPLYYMVLLLLVFHKTFGSQAPPNSWYYFFFVQNFSDSVEHFFAPSWSLSIEEWSYLIIPLVLIMLPVRKYSGNTIMIFCVAWAALILIARYYPVTKPVPEYESEIRKNIPLRLDAIIYGFAMANIKIHYPKFFNRLSSAKVFAASVIIFLILNIYIGNTLVYDFVGAKTIPGTIGFTLVGILISLWVPFLNDHWFVRKIGNFSPAKAVFGHVSQYSYCLYLVHYTVFGIIITYTTLSMHWFIQFVLALIIIFMISAASYYYFEKPILDWRDRKIRLT